MQGEAPWSTIRILRNNDIHTAIEILRGEYVFWQTPAVTIISQSERSPYKILVSCLISLRTRDAVTAIASARLFARASTPDEMSRLTAEEIASLIYPAGFYKSKSQQILAISERLISDFNGIVPDEIDILLTFKGVGRKTANLVLTLGHGIPGICVDTHVHRICNRWGYVATKSPEDTESALRERLPLEYWIPINDLLVAFGQNVCHPVSPRCSVCRLSEICCKAGVAHSR